VLEFDPNRIDIRWQARSVGFASLLAAAILFLTGHQSQAEESLPSVEQSATRVQQSEADAPAPPPPRVVVVRVTGSELPALPAPSAVIVRATRSELPPAPPASSVTVRVTGSRLPPMPPPTAVIIRVTGSKLPPVPEPTAVKVTVNRQEQPPARDFAEKDAVAEEGTGAAEAVSASFGGKWRVYFGFWWVLEIQESGGVVSGSIEHERDSKLGNGTITGERRDDVKIGRATPQDGIEGEIAMVRLLTKWNPTIRKSYDDWVEHDLKSFKFRIEDSNRLRGELCVRLKGAAKSTCRAANGERILD